MLTKCLKISGAKIQNINPGIIIYFSLLLQIFFIALARPWCANVLFSSKRFQCNPTTLWHNLVECEKIIGVQRVLEKKDFRGVRIFLKKIGNEALGSQLVVEFRLVVQLVLLMNTKIPNDCLVLVYASLSNAHL